MTDKLTPDEIYRSLSYFDRVRLNEYSIGKKGKYFEELDDTLKLEMIKFYAYKARLLSDLLKDYV